MPDTTTKRVKKVSAIEAQKSIGYGYSSLLTQLFTSFDLPVYSTDTLRTEYKRMVTEDETIGAGLEYLTGRIVSRIGAYSHEDERIKNLVDRCIETVRGTITNTRRAILRDSFVYGYSVAEFTIKNEDGFWVLSSIPVYDPLTISFKLVQYPDNSFGIGSVVQLDPHGLEVDIPVGKCIIKTYGSETTPYGQSILKRCYKWWSFKKAIPKLWAVALERFGTPLLLGKASSSRVVDAMEMALANAGSREYIVTDKESEVTAIQSATGTMGAGYESAGAFCDKQIYKALFLPSLLGAGESGGSYSLGQVHSELFNATAVALAYDYADAELEQLWRPLIEWNFGPQKSYGEFTIQDNIPTDERKTLSEMLLNLANAGVIDPESDRAWVRETLGLPEVDKDAVFPKWGLENDSQGGR